MPEFCPTTSSALRNASNTLRCSGNLMYHCLRNEKGKLTEKCLDPSWIQKYYCAEYNTAARRIDAEKCNEDLGICPIKTYLSNEVMSYSACLHQKTGDKSTRAGYSTETINASTESTSDALPNTGTSSPGAVIAVVLVLIFLVIIGIVIGIIIYRRNKKRRKKEQTMEAGRCKLLDKGTQGNDRKGDEEEKSPSLSRETTMGDLTPTLKILEEGEKKDVNEKLSKLKGELTFTDHDTYVGLRAGDRLKNDLLGGLNVFIVGKPGSGKTSLAWHTCCELVGNKRIEKKNHCAFTVCANKGNLKSFDQEKVDFVIVDDYFESCVHFPTIWNDKINELMEFCASINSRKMYAVITISSAIYNSLKENYPKTAKEFSVVDLEEEFSLNIVEVGKILNANGIEVDGKGKGDSRNSVSGESLNEIVRLISNMPIGFPLAAVLFSRDQFLRRELQGFFEKKMYGSFPFFENPIQVLKGRLLQLQSSNLAEDKDHYCTLVYIMLNGGEIENEKLKEKTEDSPFKKIAAKLKFDEPTGKIPALYEESFLLAKSDKGKVAFYHESLEQVVFLAFGEQYFDILIQFCDINILSKYTRTESKYNRQEYLIVDEANLMMMLIERFDNEGIDMESHVIWTDNRVRKAYKDRKAKADSKAVKEHQDDVNMIEMHDLQTSNAAKNSHLSEPTVDDTTITRV